ncbi:uncharacterized protein KY384_005273 [Bacidia gigantensis]|uniref:uncharacterized protein n=1 Tax=Bacidia gigantensis TaxID=2732470 RepID=UPI001D03F232|nr:uncharacterized protein KY384_005273 [Bacidia gigantensis]KAG8529792.1 hypothetical protein KY384_005273 [Bacidia gigantensis]
MPQPKVPEPAYAEIDSMLSSKFGREVANYFSALNHPSTRFLLLDNLAPLAKDPTCLEYASHEDVVSLTGDNPYKKTEEELVADYNSSTAIPQLVFLGLYEQQNSDFEWHMYRGSPYFALDITPKGSTASTAEALINSMKSKGLQFVQGRMHMSLPATQAAIYAQARALVDWNARNPYCGQCGQPTLSFRARLVSDAQIRINAGTKRTCPPKDKALFIGSSATGSMVDRKLVDRPSCATRKGISNLSFPRTDPTVIMAVVSADGERVLLGSDPSYVPVSFTKSSQVARRGGHPTGTVPSPVLLSPPNPSKKLSDENTQPWPYPANLMIGAIAQCVPNKEKIVLEHDPELEDAKWVNLKEVEDALVVGTSGLGEDAPLGYQEGGLRLPPKTAIANQLLTAVTSGFLHSSISGSKM